MKSFSMTNFSLKKLNSQNQKEDEEKLEQINLKAEFQVHSSSASVLIDFGDEFSSSLESSSMLQERELNLFVLLIKEAQREV